MKKVSFLVVALLMSVASMAQEFDSYGKKIKPKGAISMTELATKAEGKKEGINAKVAGEVESVCQAKGCWMKLKLDNGQTMRVTFKDYGFFVPKDIAGKKVIIEGLAETTTTTVEELQHYAEDAGKSKEEIAKIKEPKTELTFVANGVLIPKQ